MEPPLEIFHDEILGAGNFGTVYKGTFKGRDVAVKKVEKRHVNKEGNKREERREKDALEMLAHENVIKLFHVKEEGSFRIYILELCQSSLDRLFLDDSNPLKYKGKVPSDFNILLQFSRGLEHVHKYLIHRDIKPENVLIAVEDGFVRIKVGDFGFSKPVSINGSCELSGIKGTLNWMAPELLLLIDEYEEECANVMPKKERNFEAFLYENRASTKSDVFSAGCVFFYVVTRGVHPFGWSFSAPEKIKKGQATFFSQLNSDHFAVEIIQNMIQPKPEERVSMADVTVHLERLQANEALC